MYLLQCCWHPPTCQLFVLKEFWSANRLWCNNYFHSDKSLLYSVWSFTVEYSDFGELILIKLSTEKRNIPTAKMRSHSKSSNRCTVMKLQRPSGSPIWRTLKARVQGDMMKLTVEEFHLLLITCNSTYPLQVKAMQRRKSLVAWWCCQSKWIKIEPFIHMLYCTFLEGISILQLIT